MAILEKRFLLLLIVLSCFKASLALNLATKRQDNNTFYRFSPDKIGPFHMTTKSLSFCKPSGRVDKEHYLTSTVHVVKISRQDEEYRGFGTVPLDVTIYKLTWTISIMGGGIISPIRSAEFLDPCSNIIISTLINYFTKPERKCLIKRGNYSVNGLNINALAHRLTGDNFIYGTILSELELFSSKGSIFCEKNIYESKSLKRRRKPKK